MELQGVIQHRLIGIQVTGSQQTAQALGEAAAHPQSPCHHLVGVQIDQFEHPGEHSESRLPVDNLLFSC